MCTQQPGEAWEVQANIKTSFGLWNPLGLSTSRREQLQEQLK